MKVYKTQAEVDKDIVDGVLKIDGDVKFECYIDISASIIVNHGDITARNITAGDIDAGDIDAWNITARNITAGDIDAWNITARNINADHVSYYAFCVSYGSITCKSIKARRDVHSNPICLNGKLTIKDDESKQIINIGGKDYEVTDELTDALKKLKEV